MKSIVKELRSRTRKDFGPSANLAAPLGNDGAVAYSSMGALAVPGSLNEAECSHSFVIVSREEDREGDVIEPRGCLEFLDDYKRNPVVLYEHDATLGAIGKASHPSKGFCVYVNEDKVIAKCFFHLQPFRGENLSAECWELVRRGVLLGASIGFLPVESQRRPYGKGLHFTKWRPTEWSLTFQPVNAGTLSEDVLRMSLARGYIKSMTLKRRVESLLPPKKVCVSSGGEVAKTMSSKAKLKPAALQFDAEVYSPSQAEQYLAITGQKSLYTEKSELPSVVVFGRKGFAPVAGSQQFVAKGIVKLLGKAIKEDEDEEYGEDDMDTPAEMDEEAAETPEHEASETPEEEAAEHENEMEPEETSADSAQQAQDVADLVAHCEAAVSAFEAMAVKDHPALGKKVQTFIDSCKAVAEELRADFGTHFGDVALDSMMNKTPETPAAPVEPPPMEDVSVEDMDDGRDMDEEEVLKALTHAKAKITPVVKGMPRLAKSLTGAA